MPDVVPGQPSFLARLWRPFSAAVDTVQAKFPPNRVALALTPLIAAGAAVASPWLAQHFPGLPTFSAGQLTAYGVLAAGSIIALGYKFVDGCQKDEDRKFYGPLAPPSGDVEASHIHVRGAERVALIEAGRVDLVEDQHLPAAQPPYHSSTAPSESTGGSSPEPGAVPPQSL